MSPLNPNSPASRHIEVLWWGMLIAAGIVFLGAIAMLIVGWFRRGERGLPFLGESESINTGLVVLFGIVIPVIVLVALFIVSDLVVIRDTEAPSKGSTAMTVTVVGHQWYWEARYPGTSAVTANEIHIPVRTRVNLVAKTVDVIHSFWVPELNRKIDMIPGQANNIVLYAERPGVYRGQCAEFCGLQHAHMAMRVYAEPMPSFKRWLANMAKPAPEPTTAAARQGMQQFMNDGCASCHMIRGTEADGRIGPDLTHLATRATLAADTIPNTPANLFRWIQNPQSIKPGDKMPGLDLSNAQFHSIVDYLTGLH